jgi:hypothetical protein
LGIQIRKGKFMKKHLIIILLVLSMLAMLTGTVAAAPFAAGTVTLVSVVYVPGKGPVFTFEVNGKFTNADLKGSLHVEGGEDFDLHCEQVDSTTVKCTASKKAAGMNVTLTWGGVTYWASVPDAPTPSSQFCYSIYDWEFTEELPTSWVEYGVYCQDTPAEYGDTIEWDNPVWGLSLYEFLPEIPDADWCSFYHLEDAYYYHNCAVY